MKIPDCRALLIISHRFSGSKPHIFERVRPDQNHDPGKNTDNEEIKTNGELVQSEQGPAEAVDRIGGRVSQYKRCEPPGEVIDRKKGAREEEHGGHKKTADQLEPFRALHLGAEDKANTDKPDRCNEKEDE